MYPMKKGISLFVLLILTGLFLIFQTDRDHSKFVSKALSKLSQEEREALEAFFFELHFSGASYVLFGSKPMSICLFTDPNYSKRPPLTNVIELSTCFHLQNIKTNRGLEVWEKYKHLFPSSKFAIIETRDENYITISIIQKQNFLKIVEDNIDIFREYLGVDITANAVLEQCLTSFDVIQNHHVLLGIVLGYGRHNAQLFSRKVQIEEERESSISSPLKIQILPTEGFSSLEEEYQHITDRLMPIQQEDLWEWTHPILPLPGFIADLRDPETQQLRQQYREQHKQIIDIYKRGDFLEITLKALMCDS